MQRQNPGNNNKSITGKDVAVTGVTGLSSGVVGVGTAICVGGILAESGGIGATVGAVGGPVGLIIGGTAGLLVGFAIGVTMRVKSRKTEREIDEAKRETDRVNRLLSQKVTTIQMLEAQNKYLNATIEQMRQEMKKQSEKEKRRNERVTAALKKLGIPSEDLQSEEEKMETPMSESSRHAMQALEELEECVKCSISLDRMEDPVEGEDGKLYDRAVLKKWYETQQEQGKHPVYPSSKVPLNNVARLKSSNRAIEILKQINNKYSHYPEVQAALAQNAENIANHPELKDALPAAFVASSNSPPFHARAIGDESHPRVSQMRSRPPRSRSSLSEDEERKTVSPPSRVRDNRRSISPDVVSFHREANAPLLSGNNSRFSFSNNSAENSVSRTPTSSHRPRMFTPTAPSSSSSVNNNRDNGHNTARTVRRSANQPDPSIRPGRQPSRR